MKKSTSGKQEQLGPYLSSKQFGDLLGVPDATIRTMRLEGGILPPAIRVGKRLLRWRKADVEAWLEKLQKDGPDDKKGEPGHRGHRMTGRKTP
jgi:excisionase family DNA binding protein